MGIEGDVVREEMRAIARPCQGRRYDLVSLGLQNGRDVAPYPATAIQ